MEGTEGIRFSFYQKGEYRSQWPNLLLGIGFLAVGLIYRFVPPVYGFVNGVASESTVVLLNSAGWPFCVILGILLLYSMVADTPKYNYIELKSDRFILMDRSGNAQEYSFMQLQRVVEGKKRDKRWLELYIEGIKNPLRWPEYHMKDYISFVKKFEEIQTEYALGKGFPANVNEASVAFGANFTFEQGQFVFNGEQIGLEDLVDYTVVPFAERTRRSPEIRITYNLIERKSIILFPEDGRNRGALIALLRYAFDLKTDEAD